MEILRVEVIEPIGRKRKFQPLGLAWLGKTMTALETLCLKYLRRFAIEYWYRFAKQRLRWTLPQLASALAKSSSIAIATPKINHRSDRWFTEN
jgi:hypothetical protein